MNELVSMVVPLQTLPGWPVAPTVSPLHAIGLLIVLPAIVIVIISTIGQVGHRVAQNRPRPSWQEHAVGGGSAPTALGGSGAAALPAGRSATGAENDAESVTGDRAEQPEAQPARRSGGASGRW